MPFKFRGTVLLAGIGLATSLTGCATAADAGSDGPPDYAASTCAELAEEVVEMSAEDEVALLKVRDPQTKTDNRDGFTVPTSGEALLLSCTGTGVWSDNTDTPVLVEEEIDSDGDSFISWGPA